MRPQGDRSLRSMLLVLLGVLPLTYLMIALASASEGNLGKYGREAMSIEESITVVKETPTVAEKIVKSRSDFTNDIDLLLAKAGYDQLLLSSGE